MDGWNGGRHGAGFGRGYHGHHPGYGGYGRGGGNQWIERGDRGYGGRFPPAAPGHGGRGATQGVEVAPVARPGGQAGTGNHGDTTATTQGGSTNSRPTTTTNPTPCQPASAQQNSSEGITSQMQVDAEQAKLWYICVRATGIPEGMMHHQGIAKVGSSLGVVQEDDLDILDNFGIARFKVAIRDVKKVPHVTKITTDPFIFYVYLDVEKVVEGGGVMRDGVLISQDISTHLVTTDVSSLPNNMSPAPVVQPVQDIPESSDQGSKRGEPSIGLLTFINLDELAKRISIEADRKFAEKIQEYEQHQAFSLVSRVDPALEVPQDSHHSSASDHNSDANELGVGVEGQEKVQLSGSEEDVPESDSKDFANQVGVQIKDSHKTTETAARGGGTEQGGLEKTRAQLEAEAALLQRSSRINNTANTNGTVMDKAVEQTKKRNLESTEKRLLGGSSAKCQKARDGGSRGV